MPHPIPVVTLRSLHFVFPGIRVGCAEYDEGPTGCTVILFPKDSLVTTDMRGGSPAVVMGQDGLLDALCLSGGSLYGLESTAGVAQWIANQRSDNGEIPIEIDSIPVVRGSAIYDFRRSPPTTVYPDKPLGAFAASQAVEGLFPVGPVGAGRSATVGKLGSETIIYESSGQNAKFGTFTVGTETFRVLVGVVANAVGGIVDRSGNVVRGHFDTATKSHKRAIDILTESSANPPKGNTTLSFIATDCWMADFYARQALRQAHSSMSRGFDPFHTESDGDVAYLIRTGNANFNLTPEQWSEACLKLGTLASELLWDAILDCWHAG